MILQDIIIIYNCLPTTNVIGPSEGILLAQNKPIFTWTFDDIDCDQQNAFQVLIDDNITFQDVDFNSGEQNIADQYWKFPSGTSYSELPDGNWYWKVRTKDNDGDWGCYCAPWKIVVDTITPNSTITTPKNNGFYKSMDTLSGTAIDTTAGTGVAKVEISIKRLSDNNYWDGAAWGQDETWLLAEGIDI